MTTLVGRVVRAALTAVLGATLGFFVAVSVFADGTWDERRLTIGILLLAYGLLGAVLGFRASAWYGLGLGLPGVAALVWLGAVGDGRWWYPGYGALIVASAAGGACGATALAGRGYPAGRETTRPGTPTSVGG